MRSYQGGCRIHPIEPFPVRVVHEDAYEDAIRHANTAGGHSIRVDTLPDTPLSDELHGYPPHGYPPHGYVRALVEPACHDLDALRAVTERRTP